MTSDQTTQLTDIRLRLGGVACIACTDLIERDLKNCLGVAQVQANYTLRRVFISVNLAQTSIQHIIERIEKLGYHAFEEQTLEISAAEKKQKHSELLRLLISLFLLMQSMMFMYPFYFGDNDMDMSTANLMRWANFALTLPIMFFCARPIFSGARAELRLRRLGMDTPITIAIVIAFITSVYNTVTQQGHIYYDSIIMFVALLLSARYIQFKALNKAAEYLNELLQHKKLFAERINAYPHDKKITLVPAHELKIDDVIFIASGDVIPADAIIVEGTTSCSQALITGESQPVTKTIGNQLLAGSTNIEQAVYARINVERGSSELDTIERLAQESFLHKPHIALLAETAARYFLYLLLIICTIAGIYWWFHDVSRVVPIVVSILIITCPCALALAVPTVLTAATSALARYKVLTIKPEALEKLAHVDVYAFDKTGTLTEDVQTLLEIISERPDDMLQIAATLEAVSRHPIALALRKTLQDKDLPERMNEVDEIELVVGQGVRGLLDGKEYRIGKPSFAAQRKLDHHEFPPNTEGRSVALLGDASGQILAWFVLSDQTRKHAPALIHALQNQNCEVQLISGDKSDVVQPFAHSLDIKTAHSDASPEDKLNFVKKLQSQGKTIAMTGDGLNDAPVLQQADIAIVMGHGSSLTQMQADIVIQSGELNDIFVTHTIAQRARRLMRQNLAWAIVYNVIAIPLAATGHVTPLIASIGMAASSLIVIGNALRVLRPVKPLG